MFSTRFRAVTTISESPVSSLAATVGFVDAVCARAGDETPSADATASINSTSEGFVAAPVLLIVFRLYVVCTIRPPPEFIVVPVALSHVALEAGAAPMSEQYEFAVILSNTY